MNARTAWRDLALEVDGRQFFGQAIADHLLANADGDCLFRGTQADISAATGVSKNVASKIIRAWQGAGLLAKARNGYWLTLPGDRPRYVPEFRRVHGDWAGHQCVGRKAEILAVLFDYADWAGHCRRDGVPEGLQWTPEDFRHLQRMKQDHVLGKLSAYECLILPWEFVRTNSMAIPSCGIDHKVGHRDAEVLAKVERQTEARAILAA